MNTVALIFLVIFLVGIIGLMTWGFMAVSSGDNKSELADSNSTEIFTAEFNADSDDQGQPDLVMISQKNSDYLTGNATEISVLQDGDYDIYATVCVTDMDHSGSSDIWTANLEIIVKYADGSVDGFPTELPYNEYQPKTMQKLSVHQKLTLSAGDSFSFIASRSTDGTNPRALKISGDPADCDGTSPGIHINVSQ